MAVKRLIAVGAIAVAVLVLGGGAGAADDPWVGQWKSVDLDGSNQTLTITRRADGAYNVILFDDRAGVCAGTAARGDGVGTVSGNTMTGTTVITCADGKNAGTFPFKGTYNANNGTFTDGLGVVWSRVPAPKPARVAPLPLGRLVLVSREAPGLKPRVAKPASAKSELARAIGLRRLPPFTAAKTQIARFARGSTQLVSIAFVLKNAAAAKAAARKVGSAGKGSRIGLGNGGYTFQARQASVVWQRGRVLSAVALRIARRAATRMKIAVGYARVTDARIYRSLSRTAYSDVLSRVGPKGQLSRKTTLELYALSYGALPGTKLPPGQRARIRDGTPAARNVLRLWKTLTPAQRQAAAKALGIASVQLPGLRWTAGRSTDADYGDPGFSPDVEIQKLAEQFAKIYQQKLGPLNLQIVAGKTLSDVPGADGDALPLDAQGNLVPKPTICRVRITLSGQAVPATRLLTNIAHEVFHCMQFSIVGATSWTSGKFADWIGQGTAEWAALRVTGPPWSDAYLFSTYLDTCNQTPLYARADGSSVGFFGHTDDAVEDFWGRIEPVVSLGFKFGNAAAFDAARGNEDAFLNSWASSAFIRPKLGFSWTSKSPVQPPQGSGCAPIPLYEDAAIGADPLTVSPYGIYAQDPKRPLLHVEAFKGRARVGDGKFVDQVVHDGWFCLVDTCECPPSKEGLPPPSLSLDFPAYIGLTGGKGIALGKVSWVSLDDFCKEKQPEPQPACPPHSRSAQALSACPTGGHSPPGPGEQPEDEDPPDPIQCYGHGCARSVADPHLSPFDSPWYDFQGVGEFTLVRSTSDDLEIQVRQQPWPGSRTVSQNVAVAMRVGDDRVGVYRGNPLVVRVNGRPELLGKKDVRLPGGGTIKPLRQGQIDVVWADSSAVRVIPTGDLSTDVIVSLAASRQGKVRGLLGNNDVNTNDNDDFTTRGGRRIDPDVITGTGRRAYNLLYRVFGESWRVSQRGSLFDYVPGQSTRTFTDRSFPARIASPEAIEAGLRKKAEAICRRMRIQDPRVFRNCVLDVASTGFFSFAVSASTAERSVTKARKAPPPKIGKPGATVRWGAKTYTYRPASSQDGCEKAGKDIRFEVQFTTSPGKKLVYGFKLIVQKGSKDGTYTTGVGAAFEIENNTLVEIQSLKVTLAGSRTRGTFSGVASTPGKEPVSGSFRC